MGKDTIIRVGTAISKAMSIGKMKQLIEHPHNIMLQLKCMSMCKHRFQYVQHPLFQRAIVVDTHSLHSTHTAQHCRYIPLTQHTQHSVVSLYPPHSTTQHSVMDTHPSHSTAQCCRYTPSTWHRALDTHPPYNTTVGRDMQRVVCSSIKRGAGLSDCLISSALTD